MLVLSRTYLISPLPSQLVPGRSHPASLAPVLSWLGALGSGRNGLFTGQVQSHLTAHMTILNFDAFDVTMDMTRRPEECAKV
jgi:hypothetical protein